MVAPANKNGSKTEFVTRHLGKNPKANPEAVNKAWSEEGHEGSLSTALVRKIRSDLGLAGNLRRSSRPASGIPAPGARNGKSTGPRKTPTASAGRDRVLTEVEVDLDRLIFKLMGVGGLGEIEDALRRVRRQVVRAHGA